MTRAQTERRTRWTTWENEKLHALPADASTVVRYLAEANGSKAAAECLPRIAAGEPAAVGAEL